MPSMGHYFDCWYVIVASEYPCILHIILMSPFVSIHVFTPNVSLLQSLMRINLFSLMYPFLDFYVEIYPKLVFWIILIFYNFEGLQFLAVLSSCTSTYCREVWGDDYSSYIVFSWSRTHGQLPRFLNYWPVSITLRDTSFTAIMAVTPLWNGP